MILQIKKKIINSQVISKILSKFVELFKYKLISRFGEHQQHSIYLLIKYLQQ